MKAMLLLLCSPFVAGPIMALALLAIVVTPPPSSAAVEREQPARYLVADYGARSFVDRVYWFEPDGATECYLYQSSYFAGPSGGIGGGISCMKKDPK